MLPGAIMLPGDDGDFLAQYIINRKRHLGRCGKEERDGGLAVEGIGIILLELESGGYLNRYIIDSIGAIAAAGRRAGEELPLRRAVAYPAVGDIRGLRTVAKRIDHGQIGAEDPDLLSFLGQFISGMEGSLGRIVIGPDQHKLARRQGVIRQLPFVGIGKVVAEILVPQPYRLRIAVVDLDPVVIFAERIGNDGAVAGHELVDKQGRLVAGRGNGVKRGRRIVGGAVHRPLIIVGGNIIIERLICAQGGQHRAVILISGVAVIALTVIFHDSALPAPVIEPVMQRHRGSGDVFIFHQSGHANRIAGGGIAGQVFGI